MRDLGKACPGGGALLNSTGRELWGWGKYPYLGTCAREVEADLSSCIALYPSLACLTNYYLNWTSLYFIVLRLRSKSGRDNILTKS